MAKLNIPPGLTALLLLIVINVVVAIFCIKLFHPNEEHPDTRNPNQPSLSTTLEPTTTTSTHKINKETLKWYFTQSSTSIRAKVTAIIALPFWIWALFHVLFVDPDLGVVTFALVIISCFYVNYTHRSSRSNRSQNQNETPTSHNYQKGASITLLISNILLTCNYLLPAFFMSWPWSFLLYLVIGGVYWAYMCVWNWRGVSISE